MNHTRMLGALSLAAVTALSLSACTGFTGSGSNTQQEGTLTFTTWASESEQLHSRAGLAIRIRERGRHRPTACRALRPDVQQHRRAAVGGQCARYLPVDYGNLGVYSSQNQLLDVSPYFTPEEITQFTPAMWEAVSYDGKPYGVPHQTDVSALWSTRSC